MPVSLAPIGQQDMNRIFEVTDALGIHREKIRVSLAKRDPGNVRKDGKGVFEIVVPETTSLEDWLQGLSQTIQNLGVDHV
jgi:hypothetical protein